MRTLYFRYVRSGQYFNAALVTHWTSILVILTSMVWMLGWGVDLIFSSHEQAWVAWTKIGAVVVGYMTSVVNIFFRWHSIKRKVRYYRQLDQIRGRRKLHNKSLKGDAASGAP